MLNILQKASLHSDTTLELAWREIKNGTSKSIQYKTLRRWVVKKPTDLEEVRKRILFLKKKAALMRLYYFKIWLYPFDRNDVYNLVETYFKPRWAEKLGKRKPEILTKARAAALSHKQKSF